MATGTGKTRTVLGMIYRFLTTNRFKRILFLVDRTALGEQAHDVFREVKLDALKTLDEICGIKGLDEKLIEKETRIHISTVQGMVKRILYKDRVKVSAVVYNLRHSDIEYMRAKIWEAVEQVLASYEANNMNQTECLRQLRMYTSREAEYSACAIACVNSLASDEIKEQMDLRL